MSCVKSVVSMPKIAADHRAASVRMARVRTPAGNAQI